MKKIKTKHGSLNLPFFMPDATRAFLKTCSSSEIASAGIEVMVVNTFHLYLQPGIKVIKKAGGVHNFMNWHKPLVSDSGGFQIFSLIHQNKKMGKIDDEGAHFKSPLDGSSHFISPEKSIQIQFELGTDFIVCLDDCAPHTFIEKEIKNSLARTLKWAQRCRVEYIKQIKKRKIKEEDRPRLTAVIQGGLSLELRKKCLDALLEISEEIVLGEKIPFTVYGFGGRPVDEQGNFLAEVLDYTAKIIPDDKLKFALGIGSPSDIVACHQMGWNIFDCVIPSREGRHGKLYQFLKDKKLEGNKFYQEINVKNSKNILNFEKIKKDSKIADLREYSLAYLHHLFKSDEALGYKLASLNNLEFYSNLMLKIKEQNKL